MWIVDGGFGLINIEKQANTYLFDYLYQYHKQGLCNCYKNENRTNVLGTLSGRGSEMGFESSDKFSEAPE